MITARINVRQMFDEKSRGIKRHRFETSEHLMEVMSDFMADDWENEKIDAFNKLMLDDFGEKFYSHVRGYRKDKLTVPEEQVFNGNLWTAQDCQKLGLIDEVGQMYEVKDNLFPDSKLVNYSQLSPIEKMAESF